MCIQADFGNHNNFWWCGSRETVGIIVTIVKLVLVDWSSVVNSVQKLSFLRKILQICSNLQKKSLTGNYIFVQCKFDPMTTTWKNIVKLLSKSALASFRTASEIYSNLDNFFYHQWKWTRLLKSCVILLSDFFFCLDEVN